jgi:hypothetical protein
MLRGDVAWVHASIRHILETNGAQRVPARGRRYTLIHTHTHLHAHAHILTRTYAHTLTRTLTHSICSWSGDRFLSHPFTLDTDLLVEEAQQLWSVKQHGEVAGSTLRIDICLICRLLLLLLYCYSQKFALSFSRYLNSSSRSFMDKPALVKVMYAMIPAVTATNHVLRTSGLMFCRQFIIVTTCIQFGVF